jgi:hypothetical protein
VNLPQNFTLQKTNFSQCCTYCRILPIEISPIFVLINVFSHIQNNYAAKVQNIFRIFAANKLFFTAFASACVARALRLTRQTASLVAVHFVRLPFST